MISRIEIQNLFGIKQIDFRPGTITIVSGANGTGKSSILNAFLLIFERLHNPSAIRKGANEGGIRVTLDGGAQIHKRITATKSFYEITDENGLEVNAYREYLDDLASSWSLDPSKLLSIDTSTVPGRRALADELAKIMPIKFEDGELLAELNPQFSLEESAREKLAGLSPIRNLDDLEKVKKRIEDSRRQVGRDKDEAEKTVKTLKKSLPPAEDLDVNWQGVLDKLLQKRDLLRAQEEDEILRVRTKFAGIQELQSEEIGRSETKVREQTRIAGMSATIAQLDEQWGKKQTEYDMWSVVLQAVERLKKRKLDDLPIAGMEFSADNVLVNGVEWQNLNSSQKGFIAAQLCTMREGRIHFLVYDDIEHQDAALRNAFLKGLTDAGWQVLAAKVIEYECPKCHLRDEPNVESLDAKARQTILECAGCQYRGAPEDWKAPLRIEVQA